MDLIKVGVTAVGVGVLAAISYSSVKGNQSGLKAEIDMPARVCVGDTIETRLKASGGEGVYFADWQLNGPNDTLVSQGFDMNADGLSIWSFKIPYESPYTLQAVVATAPQKNSAFNVMPSVSVETKFQAEYCP